MASQGCGKNKEKDKISELVKELVAKGDEMAKKDKDTAIFAYEFAALYAPDDEEVLNKKASIEDGRIFSASNDEIVQMDKAIEHSSLEDLKSWPDPIPEVELRILLDEKLVGKLRYSVASHNRGEISAKVFSSQPILTMAQVLSTYGKPSTERKNKDGASVVTYGRIRLIADKSGKVVGVFFRDSGS